MVPLPDTSSTNMRPRVFGVHAFVSLKLLVNVHMRCGTHARKKFPGFPFCTDASLPSLFAGSPQSLGVLPSSLDCTIGLVMNRRLELFTVRFPSTHTRERERDRREKGVPASQDFGWMSLRHSRSPPSQHWSSTKESQKTRQLWCLYVSTSSSLTLKDTT